MQKILKRIISFFMTVLAFFGLIKNPSAPAGPDTPAQPDPPEVRTVQYIAHRGATFAAPENTLPALTAAARDGCTGVEIDIRQTSDGVIVLSHNEKVKGTVNGEQTTLSISKSTYEALCALSFGQDANGGDIGIATLPQALELLRSLDMTVAIHCKIYDTDFLRQAARTVRECGMSGRCAYNTDKDFDVTFPVILSEDPGAAFHVPYETAFADPTVKELVTDPGKIIVTVEAGALSDEAAARIRADGFGFYIWNVTAESFSAALAAAPDYIEFVSGVSVKELTSAQ